jgi:hypothetical protein
MLVSDDFHDILERESGAGTTISGAGFAIDSVRVAEDGALACVGAFKAWAVYEGKEATETNKIHDERGIFGQKEKG